jgi:uroporphyrinogen decarboxylase
MTGREIVLKTFAHEQTEQVPWVPFAGVHAGKLVGKTAQEVGTNIDALMAGLLEANRLYHPDGQPVLFDLQIEAEILGCELLWAEDAPPTVRSHPLESVGTIPDTLPQATDGRMPIALEATRGLKAKVGEQTAIYGLFCGPFTLASHLRGTNIFMDMFDDPEYVQRLLAYTCSVGKRMADLYREAGADVVAAVDPLVSQISPDHFTEFLHEPFLELFSHIRGTGAYSSFFVCGDATKNIEVMCKTGPDGISIDENIDLPTAKQISDRYNIVMAGNIPLASVMLFGSQQDNMKIVVDLLDSVDHHNLIVSPGCDMPYDVPPENTVGCEQAVHQTEQTRALVANYTATGLEIDVDLPDYDTLPRPLIEVFTIDSDTCAACTYMFQSAMDAKREFGTGVDVVEYKTTSKENIVRARQMGVKQLPSIYINGRLAFSSIIPSREALNKEIRAVME